MPRPDRSSSTASAATRRSGNPQEPATRSPSDRRARSGVGMPGNGPHAPWERRSMPSIGVCGPIKAEELQSWVRTCRTRHPPGKRPRTMGGAGRGAAAGGPQQTMELARCRPGSRRVPAWAGFSLLKVAERAPGAHLLMLDFHTTKHGYEERLHASFVPSVVRHWQRRSCGGHVRRRMTLLDPDRQSRSPTSIETDLARGRSPAQLVTRLAWRERGGRRDTRGPSASISSTRWSPWVQASGPLLRRARGCSRRRGEARGGPDSTMVALAPVI
jgi:hypothetical protein